MLTLNQNVNVGNEVLHVQTEPYRASGKVVSNILKGGIVVRRIEKEIPPGAEEREINELVKALHYSVVNAIVREYESKNVKVVEEKVEEEKVAETKGTVFTLPEDIRHKLEDYASEYVGFYAPTLVEELIEKAKTLEEFIDLYKQELQEAEDVDEFLKKVFKKYLFELNIESSLLETNFSEVLNKELLEDILTGEFGFLAPQVAEDIQEKLKVAKTLSEAIDIIKDSVEEEETRQKIEKEKKKLFRI